MHTATRVALSLGALLVSVTLFSLLLPNVAGSFRAESIALTFRVTLTFALPVWCLYLPFVIALKDAEEHRIWTILLSGILIGPASLALWSLILQQRGASPHTNWQSDPLTGLGGAEAMIFATIVGSLTASLYVIALKVLHRA